MVLALLIAAHGWAPLLHDVATPFGSWLDGPGFPAGVAIAWMIMGMEIIGSLLLLLGLAVLRLCPVFSAIHATGIVLVHAPWDGS